jgi:glycosyltransferase involved in cell wall biosynthesis
MTERVSAIIPTVGRSTLRRAIASVLGQTRPPDEIIVVADTDEPVDVPPDDRISVLRNGVATGPARARQRGIDAARGSIVAMLDDDDEWKPAKLDLQLRAAREATSKRWIVSSRVEACGPGDSQRIWPRRLLRPGQPIADYLFRFTGLRAGGSLLQSSTLCFPTALGREQRWDAHAESIHDEPSWLIDVQRSFPDIEVIHLPDVLSVYHLDGPSVSRQARDLTADYIAWGTQRLRTESPRVIGDYLCTNPVSAAVSAHSLDGVRLAMCAAIRYGRPGPFALSYALLNAGRIMLSRSHRSTPTRWEADRSGFGR